MLLQLRPASRLLSYMKFHRTISNRSRHTALLTCLRDNDSTPFNLNLALLSPNKLLNIANRTTAQDASSVQKSGETEDIVKSEDTFASLLRNSAFMQIGNPIGKVKLIFRARGIESTIRRSRTRINTPNSFF